MQVMIDDLTRDFIQTAEACGLCLMSADRAARILAMLYIFGGDHESFTMNPKWQTAVKIAQSRANITGGEIPNADVVTLIKARVKELAPSGLNGPRTVTDWAREIAKEYGLYMYGLNDSETIRKAKRSA